MQDTKSYVEGVHVIYVDAKGKEHDALITRWWGIDHYKSAGGEPGCNLVYVVEDPTREDPYGRQKQHETSVIHKTAQPAHGNYWRWPDET